MHEIDKEKFGAFVAQLRREKGCTQKELAQQLLISDKAVSKWETGASLPDVTMLQPLAEQLGVTVTELLYARRMAPQEQIPTGEVEQLVHSTIQLSSEEHAARARRRRMWRWIYVGCLLAVGAEAALLLSAGFSLQMLQSDLLLVEFLCLLFGGWFCLGAPEMLPAYYDQNKISTISSGIFRMNLVGVSFNNRNWLPILEVGRGWMTGAAVITPLLYALLAGQLSQRAWQTVQLVICLGFFLPVYMTARRHK
jgi:transcriptional regulator with XRE-family HTH domain